MVLNKLSFLFEISAVIENHPSIARAAALITQVKMIFYMKGRLRAIPLRSKGK